MNSLKYSQDFLKSFKLAKSLVRKASLKKGEIVYEIGPGKGILTDILSKIGVKVIAVEKDKKLYLKLKEKFSKVPNVFIKFGDFLKEKLPENKKYKVFSNIPFSITIQIIHKLTDTKNPPEETYLIIQKEAAEKFTGKPYGKERQYSLFLKPWFELEIICSVKRENFYPVPKVDSVLFKIKKRPNPLIDEKNTQLYKDFIVYGFNQHREVLEKSFKKIFTHKQFRRLSEDLGFSRKSIPTDLNFKQWLGLFNYFIVGVEKSKKELVCGSEKSLKYQQSKIQKIHRTRRY
jgi:23S rRNA (adenine-N6)-dimethyltransferase